MVAWTRSTVKNFLRPAGATFQTRDGQRARNRQQEQVDYRAGGKPPGFSSVGTGLSGVFSGAVSRGRSGSGGSDGNEGRGAGSGRTPPGPAAGGVAGPFVPGAPAPGAVGTSADGTTAGPGVSAAALVGGLRAGTSLGDGPAGTVAGSVAGPRSAVSPDVWKMRPTLRRKPSLEAATAPAPSVIAPMTAPPTTARRRLRLRRRSARLATPAGSVSSASAAPGIGVVPAAGEP
jgi:hypothetical protein